MRFENASDQPPPGYGMEPWDGRAPWEGEDAAGAGHHIDRLPRYRLQHRLLNEHPPACRSSSPSAAGCLARLPPCVADSEERVLDLLVGTLPTSRTSSGWRVTKCCCASGGAVAANAKTASSTVAHGYAYGPAELRTRRAACSCHRGCWEEPGMPARCEAPRVCPQIAALTLAPVHTVRILGWPAACSMVWPTNPDAMACSRCVSWSPDAPAGRRRHTSRRHEQLAPGAILSRSGKWPPGSWVFVS
jgi:hypothetical protein